ncbi:MAG: RNA polymerase TFIIH complex subunit Ssl1 [Olpidium bornovanus]|uniref:RNA polymerase TFIIH complex subunit Ssl1 n=1 Tax=Olpidium bornovanus TaxID=278681 RepID=A0A8H8DK14_9FUNG|nr:MAG: RNA polymerase TFIIH complex subunit Ssl1 [Olpidium bornovanus]
MSARAAAAAAERRRAAGGGPPAAADSSSEVDVDGDGDGDGDGGGADDDDDDDTYDPRGRSRGGAAGALPGGERAEAASAAPGYSWEEEYKRSWDVLQEDETGSLGSVVQNLLQQQKRKRLLRDTSTIHRGIIRHLFLIIDLSTAMLEKDLRPSRLELTFQYAYEFVQEYFDQNPISQLGIITTRDGVAEKLTELSGAHYLASLSLLLTFSFTSRHIPAHGSREILVILASLTTCDPGDLSGTIMQVKKDNIRASVIALAAEVQICKVLCKETKGTYAVPLNEPHFKEILFELIPPPAVTAASDATNLVVMGFPKRITDDAATLCAWWESNAGLLRDWWALLIRRQSPIRNRRRQPGAGARAAPQPGRWCRLH